MNLRNIGILILAASPHNIDGFVTNTNAKSAFGSITKSVSSASTSASASRVVLKSASSFDDFQEYPQDPSPNSSDSEDIYASLRARQDYLSSFGTSSPSFGGQTQMSEEDVQAMSNWKNAQCSSTIRLSLNDWIRRIAIDTYPLAACGSASGSIYLADLEKGEELDCIENVHQAQIDDEDVADAMQRMYGTYDGSGVVAIAIHKDIVVSAGREGGINVCKIDGEEKSSYKGSRGGSAKSTMLRLELEGKLSFLDETLVTSLAFDNDGMLWVGCYDGFIRAFEYNDKDKTLIEQTRPTYEMDMESEVLNLSVNNDIGCGVAATASGHVVLFNLDEGEIMASWKPFGKGVGKRKREFARTALIVKTDEASSSNEALWSIICGGSEGSLFQRRLNVDQIGYVSDNRPLLDDEALRGRLRPSHNMPVMSLASPFAGLLVSGSQDGTIRIWDCSYHRSLDDEGIIISNVVDIEEEEEAQCDDVGDEDKRPRCLYALTGYKVWLGSIFTNGKKLVSDGADNTIVVHDYWEDDNAEEFLFDDDDLEDFSDFD